jgi:predicted GTPase
MQKNYIVSGIIGAILLSTTSFVFAAKGGIVLPVTPGVVAPCAAISSDTMKAKSQLADTWQAVVTLDYSTKSCIGNAVRTIVDIQETISGVTVYHDENATAVGKLSLILNLYTSYMSTVTVVDAVTGEVIDSQVLYAKAIPKV